MNGSAPNSPATGSHSCVCQKLRPKRRMDGIDSSVSTAPIATTIAIRISPKTPVPIRKPSSLLDLDFGKGSQLELHHDIGQRRVSELRAVLLADGERPFHELDHRFRLRFVLGV